jgi:phage tail sheath protein FI
MPVRTTYPGVYIEELPSGVRTIVGVSTSVTAFVGAARMGPAEPVRIRNVADYVRTFGPPWDAARPMGHSVGHFVANGGGEAIVVRLLASDATVATATLQTGAAVNTLVLDASSAGTWAAGSGGVGLEATVEYTTASNPEDLFTLVLTLRGVDPGTGLATVLAQETYADLSMSPLHQQFVNTALGSSSLAHVAATSPAPGGTVKGFSLGGTALTGSTTITTANNILRVSLDHAPPVDVTLADGANMNRPALATAIGASMDASNRLRLEAENGGPNSAVVVLPAPSDASATLSLGRANGGSEMSGSAALRPAAGAWPFGGGGDGSALTAEDVVPADGTGGIYGLSSLLFPRFNILCLPGLTAGSAQELGRALAYCGQERAFLVVDAAAGFPTDPPALGSLPALGEHGALYYPRLVQVEGRPGGQIAELDLPACGAVAGVFARTDSARGVWKAPAGLEAGLVGFTSLSEPTSDAESGLLNPKGVNVLRTFPAAGPVVWGARTLRGDDALSSEFKYVPIRRLTNFIASTLYIGTGFAVFEGNDPDLWAQLRLAVGAFMRGLFRQGAFQQSAKRAESDSFFVTCDETVNTQSEIDLGRVNVVVGFAPLKPAEFVIVSIRQISQLEE